MDGPNKKTAPLEGAAMAETPIKAISSYLHSSKPSVCVKYPSIEKRS